MRVLSLLLIVLVLVACTSSSNRTGEASNKTEAAKVRMSLGLTYLKNGNFRQAKYNLDQALKFAPRMADVHYSMAYYYQQVGESVQARQSYETALNRAPDNPDILNSYGAFLCQQGDFDASDDYFHRALRQQNYINAAETYENLALCNAQRGQNEKAQEYLRKALQHQPDRGKSLMLLTELLVKQQQWSEAQAVLGRYEQSGKVTPDMLYLAYQIEQGMDNTQRASGYLDMLVQLYPEHSLTKALQRPSVSREKNSVARPSVKPQATAARTLPNPAPEVDQVKHHVVQSGENLYRISVKYNIRIQSLMEWNDLQSEGDLRSGMKLRLTPPQAR